MSRTQLLVLAIDAASPTLLERWAADGTLPNLRALLDRGLSGGTHNVDGFHIGSTWPSWYTGVSPACHGLHYLVQLRPGTYDMYQPADEGLVQREAVWSHLSRAGRRVAVLDVPVCPIDPALGSGSIQTIEWGGHDRLFGIRSQPADLAREIVSRFGAHPLRTACDEIHRTAEGYAAFVDRLVDGVEAKAAWTIDLLERDGWDLFVQVFTEAHCVGHQCWHVHDGEHPAHDPDLRERTGDPLRTVYQAIDVAIGRVLERAASARVLVLSLHGMAHAFGAQFLLRDLLVRLGVTHPRPIAPAEPGAGAAVTDRLRAVWRRLPPALRERVAPFRRLVERRSTSDRPRLDVDTTRSRCFPHPNGLAVGGIRLNLAGREPAGTIDLGPAADAFAAQLTRDLLEIVDQRSGRPLIRDVWRTRDRYAGEHLDTLPDLLVEWDDAVALGSALIGAGAGATVRAASPKIGAVEGTNRYGRTGEHRPEGLFVAAGPGTPSGRLPSPVSILDFAPTLAALLGAPLPESDGRCIPELLAAWR